MLLLDIIPIDLEKFNDQFVAYLFSVGPNILLGITTLLAGYYLIRFLTRILKKSFAKYNVEPSLATFLSSLIRVLLYVMLIITVASTLGVQTASFVAVLAAGGLAVGLALQGSLSNFAGGVLILLFKPFRVEEIIDAQGFLGVVEKIEILQTTLRTFDNRVIIMPNGALANSNITNISRKDTRRVELEVGIAYSSSVKQARQVILDVLKQDARILPDPEPEVLLSNLGDSSLDLKVRCWVKADDFWPVFWENLEAIKEALDDNGITIPFPQRDVHLIQVKEG